MVFTLFSLLLCRLFIYIYIYVKISYWCSMLKNLFFSAYGNHIICLTFKVSHYNFTNFTCDMREMGAYPACVIYWGCESTIFDSICGWGSRLIAEDYYFTLTYRPFKREVKISSMFIMNEKGWWQISINNSC